MHFFHFSLPSPSYFILSMEASIGTGSSAYANLDFKGLKCYLSFWLMGKMEGRSPVRILDADGRRFFARGQGVVVAAS